VHVASGRRSDEQDRQRSKALLNWSRSGGNRNTLRDRRRPQGSDHDWGDHLDPGEIKMRFLRRVGELRSWRCRTFRRAATAASSEGRRCQLEGAAAWLGAAQPEAGHSRQNASHHEDSNHNEKLPHRGSERLAGSHHSIRRCRDLPVPERTAAPCLPIFKSPYKALTLPISGGPGKRLQASIDDLARSEALSSARAPMRASSKRGFKWTSREKAHSPRADARSSFLPGVCGVPSAHSDASAWARWGRRRDVGAGCARRPARRGPPERKGHICSLQFLIVSRNRSISAAKVSSSFARTRARRIR
jgi:hypothetical protein